MQEQHDLGHKNPSWSEPPGHARAATSTNSVAQGAEKERHGGAEDGGDERGRDSGGTGRRARRGPVGSQRNPDEGRYGDGSDDDGAEDLGGHDPTRNVSNAVL